MSTLPACSISSLVRRVAFIMQPTLIRRQLGGLVPPKIATPSILVSVRMSRRMLRRCVCQHASIFPIVFVADTPTPRAHSRLARARVSARS